MASKPKAKAAAVQPAEPEVVEEVAEPVVSYKLSLPDSLAMLRDIDISDLTDDDRRAAILEIKALLDELQAAEKPHDDYLEQRMWLLQTWDNVIRQRLDEVRQELILPEYSIEVTRLFDEAKLALAAAEEAARIAAEKAALLEAEAKAKAEAEAALLAEEHGEHAPVDAGDHAEDAPPAEAATAAPVEHEDPVEVAAVAQADEDEVVPADHDGKIIAEDEDDDPDLILEADEDGFVKLRLLERTEITRIRLPAHIYIEIPLEHAEELVNKEAARPLRQGEVFEPKE